MATKKVKSPVKKKKPAKQKSKELSQESKGFSPKHQRKLDRMGQDINSGAIKTFDGLFDILDKTPLANAMGYQQFEAKLKNPLKFNMGDVLKLAQETKASEEKTVLLFLYFAMGRNKDNFEQLHKNNTTGKP